MELLTTEEKVIFYLYSQGDWLTVNAISQALAIKCSTVNRALIQAVKSRFLDADYKDVPSERKGQRTAVAFRIFDIESSYKQKLKALAVKPPETQPLNVRELAKTHNPLWSMVFHHFIGEQKQSEAAV